MKFKKNVLADLPNGPMLGAKSVPKKADPRLAKLKNRKKK